MVLLKVPLSPRKWPVAIAELLAMVKVGKIECGFLKLTPLSRIAAIAGAVSGVTFSARKPSGTNRIRLWGVALSADAAPATNVKKLADSSTIARCMKISPGRNGFAACELVVTV